MSFLQPKIIPRGYIASTSNRTTPRKRLSSVSEISLKPALPTLPRPYVKRANIDPFEQHYVTPFLRMFDEEEAENAKNRLITDEQKSTLRLLAEAAASSELGRRIVYGARRTYEHPVESLYDLVTLPADIVHALETKINTGNETGRAIKLLQTEEEQEENANYQDEKDKEIRQTVDDISTFVRRTGGLPTWGIRKLKQLKKKYFDEDDVDVSSDLQAWNKEEEEERRLQREAASQQMQGLITSNFQQKGYKERMDATKSLQSLLKAQKVQKEQERQQEATKALQGLLRGVNPQHEFEKINASSQQLQGLLALKKQQKEDKARQEVVEDMQGSLQQPIVQQKQLEKDKKKIKKRLVARRHAIEKLPVKEEDEESKVTATKRLRGRFDDYDLDFKDVIRLRDPKKKSRFDTSGAFEQPPNFNLDLMQIRRDLLKFFEEHPEPTPEEIPDKIHAELEIFLREKDHRLFTDRNSLQNGYYYYYIPKRRELKISHYDRLTPTWYLPTYNGLVYYF